MENKKDIEEVLLSKSSTIDREKLIGHRGAVNSLDLLQENSTQGDYLAGPLYRENGLLLSSSDD